jgi:hypothetical protein
VGETAEDLLNTASPVTPRRLQTSLVSLMSNHGISIEEIAQLAGSPRRTTEVVYRRELRPVITTGAEVMDKVFGEAKPVRLTRTSWAAGRDGEVGSLLSTTVQLRIDLRTETRLTDGKLLTQFLRFNTDCVSVLSAVERQIYVRQVS